MQNLNEFLQIKKALIDQELTKVLSIPTGPHQKLVEAMNYSLNAGGKRLRPILCLTTAEMLGADIHAAMPIALALEMLHTASLIHDDLPAMDNDDLRRGKPTNHKVYGEALAILAGDALLIESFRLVVSRVNDATKAARIIRLLAQASGVLGMMAGQAVDLVLTGQNTNLPTLEFMHVHKTGCLIMASLESAAIFAGAENTQIEALREYGSSIGLAFQITDDILDVEGDTSVLGKTLGKDINANKTTYPRMLGLKESKLLVNDKVDQAMAALSIFGFKADILKEMAQYFLLQQININ